MLQTDPDTGCLPPGEHPASLADIEQAFCGTYRRREIFKGLVFVVSRLRDRGVTRIWIDGSFVTNKERPGDVDVVFDPDGADTTGWGLLTFARRHDLKRIHRVDLWPHPSPQGITGVPIAEWFQTDREGEPKGIVVLTMEEAGMR